MKRTDREGGYHDLTRGLMIAGHLAVPHINAHLPDVSSLHFPPPIIQSSYTDIFVDVATGISDHTEHDLGRPGRMRGARLPSAPGQEGQIFPERNSGSRRKAREARKLGFRNRVQDGVVFFTDRSDDDGFRVSMYDVGHHAEDLSKALSLYSGVLQEKLPERERRDHTRQLGMLEYDLRRFNSLSADRQQEVGQSVIKILSDVPPAPEGWTPTASTDADQEKVDWALTLLAEVGLGAVATGLLYQLGKNRRKAVPVLVAFASLVAACGRNVAGTATALFPGGGQPTTEQAPTPTQMLSPTAPPSSPIPEASATTGSSGFGGLDQTCEAAASSFLAPRMSPEGAKVPFESMVSHSGNPDKWSDADKAALVDDKGNSIAPTIYGAKTAISAIDSGILVTKVWTSSEGYVLDLHNARDQLVWAMGQNGIAQYRPDIVDGTDGFRVVPDAPVSGEKRYVVTGGCGILGVFDKKGNMVAMYKPLTDEWVMLTGDNAAQEAFGTPATPVATEQLATITPFPSETPAPTATPAELIPTSCLDEGAQQHIVDTYLADLAKTKGSPVTFTDAMNDFETLHGFTNIHTSNKVVNGVINHTPWRIFLDKVVVLGRFRIGLENGHGNCITVAYRVKDKQGVVHDRVISLLTDATIGGKWSGSSIVFQESENKLKLLFNEDESLQWADQLVGSVRKISIAFASSPESQSRTDIFTDNTTYPWPQNRSIIGAFAAAGYVNHYGSDDSLFVGDFSGKTDLSKPDPAVLVDQFPEGDIGLIAAEIY